MKIDWTSVLNTLIMNAPLIINAIVDGINKLRKKQQKKNPFTSVEAVDGSYETQFYNGSQL